MPILYKKLSLFIINSPKNSKIKNEIKQLTIYAILSIFIAFF